MSGRRLRARPGQGLVEFALVLPVFLLLIMGIVEFSRALQADQLAEQAARVGARTAVVADPTVTADTVIVRVKSHFAQAGFDSSRVLIDMHNFRAGSGSQFGIRVRYPHTMGFLRPFVGWTGAQATVTITGQYQMRNE